MTEEIAVYKLQEWDMGNGEKKYSQLGNLEAHYYFAKNNGGKVLFTTKSDLYQRRVWDNSLLSPKKATDLPLLFCMVTIVLVK